MLLQDPEDHHLAAGYTCHGHQHVPCLCLCGKLKLLCLFLVVPMLKGCLADLSESVVIKLIAFRQPNCSNLGFLK